MTANEFTSAEEAYDGPRFGTIALAGLAGLVLLFGVGVFAGVSVAFVNDAVRSPTKAMTGMALALVLAIGSGLVLWRTVPRLRQQGVISPRTKRARSMLYLSMAVGVVIGATLQFSTFSSDPRDGFTGPVSPTVALVVIAIWLVAVPLLSWRWWRNVDEHEALSYKDGALMAMYAYSAIAPTWWMGWRGGFLPEPDAMAIYVAVLTIWGVVWGVRRFR